MIILWGKQQAGLGPEISPSPRLRASTLYRLWGSLSGDLRLHVATFSKHLSSSLLSWQQEIPQALGLHPTSILNVCWVIPPLGPHVCLILLLSYVLFLLVKYTVIKIPKSSFSKHPATSGLPKPWSSGPWGKCLWNTEKPNSSQKQTALTVLTNHIHSSYENRKFSQKSVSFNSEVAVSDAVQQIQHPFHSASLSWMFMIYRSSDTQEPMHRNKTLQRFLSGKEDVEKTALLWCFGRKIKLWIKPWVTLPGFIPKIF